MTSEERYKVVKRLPYNTGDFVSSEKLKARFKKIYSELGINKVAKGTDIKDYFLVKECVVKENYITIRGFKLELKKWN